MHGGVSKFLPNACCSEEARAVKRRGGRVCGVERGQEGWRAQGHGEEQRGLERNDDGAYDWGQKAGERKA